jgi:rubrerythrin
VCDACGYDLRGVGKVKACPECGKKMQHGMAAQHP